MVFPAINPREIAETKEKEEILIPGSGMVVRQLAGVGLIDEYTLGTVIPGKGRPFFTDVHRKNRELHGVRHLEERHRVPEVPAAEGTGFPAARS